MTAKSIGPLQRSLLARAMRRAVLRLDPVRQQSAYKAAVKLHVKGLFARGKTAADFSMTQAGRDYFDGQKAHD